MTENCPPLTDKVIVNYDILSYFLPLLKIFNRELNYLRINNRFKKSLFSIVRTLGSI